MSRVDRTGQVSAGKEGRHRGAGGGLAVKLGRSCTESDSYPCSMDYGARGCNSVRVCDTVHAGQRLTRRLVTFGVE